MWTLRCLLPVSLLLLWLDCVYAANFTFDYGSVSECDQFQISWQGGVAPYQLTIVPAFGRPQTFSIPDSGYSNGKGSFSTTLTHAINTKLVAVMSDTNGFGTGGVSPMITVGASTSGGNCNSTEPHPDFTFSTNSALTECQQYPFNEYDGAVRPVTILGMIPGGSAFYVANNDDATTVDWTVDVPSGTYTIFTMQDSKGRSGGASDFTPVGLSGSNACLSGSSPSSFAAAPSQTTSATNSSPKQTGSAGNPSSSSSSSNSSKTVKAGVVAGAVVGGLVGLAAVIGAIWLCLRWQNRKDDGRFDTPRPEEVDLVKGVSPPPSSNPYSPSASLFPSPTSAGFSPPSMSYAHPSYPSASAYAVGTVPGATYPYPSVGEMYQIPPALRPGSPVLNGSEYGHAPVPGTFTYGPVPQFGAAVTGSNASATAYTYSGALSDDMTSVGHSRSAVSTAPRTSKAAAVAAAAAAQPASVIVHRDMEDEVVQAQEERVVELPPQYNERRAQSSVASGSGNGDQKATSRLACVDGDHESVHSG